MRNISLVVVILFGLSSGIAQAQLGALRDRVPGGGGDAPSPAVDLDVLSADLDKSILEVGIARKILIESQLLLAEALGIKEEADQIASAAGVLGEGGVVAPTNAEGVENSIQASGRLNDRIRAAAEQAGVLDDQSRVKYAEGQKRFVDGLVAEAAQIAVLTRLVSEFDGARGQVSRNPVRLRQLTALSVPTIKLASLIPGDVRAMHGTWSLIRKVGQDNQIDSDDIDLNALLSGAQ
jgi:hypothetical protein